MCEFCTKHGEGKKWYLRVENYSKELCEKLKSEETGVYFGKNFNKIMNFFEGAFGVIDKMPRSMRQLAKSLHSMWQKKMHIGQVIPLEDAYEVLERMSSIVRLPCLCRRYSVKEEGRYCLGITLNPIKDETKRNVANIFYGSPDLSNLEYLTFDEVKSLLAEYDKKGLVHTIWTMKTPYVVAVCNCEVNSCTGFRFVHRGIKAVLRAEYVAVLDPEKCIGCSACLKNCHFNAIHYVEEVRKVHIHAEACYGCGLCRAKCDQGAIKLIERHEHVTARNIW